MYMTVLYLFDETMIQSCTRVMLLSDPQEFNEMPDSSRATGQCQAIYDYDPKQPDELTIRKSTRVLSLTPSC